MGDEATTLAALGGSDAYVSGVVTFSFYDIDITLSISTSMIFNPTPLPSPPKSFPVTIDRPAKRARGRRYEDVVSDAFTSDDRGALPIVEM